MNAGCEGHVGMSGLGMSLFLFYDLKQVRRVQSPLDWEDYLNRGSEGIREGARSCPMIDSFEKGDVVRSDDSRSWLAGSRRAFVTSHFVQ